MHYGSVGAGSPPNLMAELFNSMAKVRTVHVPYKGGAGSSGHMDLELFRVMAGIDLIMVHYKGAGAATIDLLGGPSRSPTSRFRLRFLTSDDVKKHFLNNAMEIDYRDHRENNSKRSVLIERSSPEPQRTAWRHGGWRSAPGNSVKPVPVAASRPIARGR